MISHVNLGTNDLGRAIAFYDRLLATLGLVRWAVYPDDGYAKYTAGTKGGTAGGEGEAFFVGHPFDGGSAGVGNGTCCVFEAPDPLAVEDFAATATLAGGAIAMPSAPGRGHLRGYIACTVRDPDGNLIVAASRRDGI